MMNSSLRPAISLIATLLLTASFGISAAQELYCDQLQVLTGIAAKDSTMQSIRLAEKTTGEITGGPGYSTVLSILKNDDYTAVISYIGYNKAEHHFSYYCHYESMADETKEIKDKMRACLGDAWALQVIVMGSATDTTYYLKNPATFVVVKIQDEAGATLIECYNDTKNSAPVCLAGNCDAGLGQTQYFNGDIYAGSFLNGKANGFGAFVWKATGQQYYGSFIDGQMAGNGVVQNAAGDTIASGVFFKGEAVKIDTNQKTCQQGNCQTGFGLQVYPGGYYVGNFASALHNGPGEQVYANAVYYGSFTNNIATGKVVFVNAAGDYFFAAYWNGSLQGKYERVMRDKTSLVGYVETNYIDMFNADNILIKSGDWKPPVFTEKTEAGYLDLKAFATSLSGFYEAKSTVGFGGLRGDARNETIGQKLLANMGLAEYKSKKLFMDKFETSVDADAATSRYYIKADLSKNFPSKANLINLYKKYHDLLKAAAGTRWNIVADEWMNGLTGLKSKACNYIIQNSFDKTMFAKLSYDKTNGVVLEIH